MMNRFSALYVCSSSCTVVVFPFLLWGVVRRSAFAPVPLMMKLFEEVGGVLSAKFLVQQRHQ